MKRVLPLLALVASAPAACTQDAASSDASDIIGGVEAKSAKLHAIGTLGNKGYDGSVDSLCTAILIASAWGRVSCARAFARSRARVALGPTLA